MSRELTRAGIAAELGVAAHFDVEAEAAHRTKFLMELLVTVGARCLVLGISGGVDSATAALLCARAVRGLPAGRAKFVAVRLPYGRQADDADAHLVLDTVGPDQTLTLDVAPASDALLMHATRAGLRFPDAVRRDLVLGNIKARQRMVAQYAIAGTLDGLVIGTDHAAEALTGFFTKYGDGGVDAHPLAGLTKRRVRALGAHLGLPDSIVSKTPTADLESLRPQVPDEDVLGVTYDEIDDYLEGKPVSGSTAQALSERFRITAHKRAEPLVPSSIASQRVLML